MVIIKSLNETKIMKNYKINFLSTLFILIAVSFQNYLYGQEKENIKVQATLVDEKDNPIPNALIVLGDGLVETNSNLSGNFTLDAGLNNIMIISANGYKTKVIHLNKEVIEEKIVLASTSLFDGGAHEIVLPANLKTTQRALTGAVSKVSGEELESQPDIVFHNALQGRLAGVTARMTTNGLGNNHPAIYVRGLGSENANTALYIVDGLERPIDFLNAEEIESVEVLKDASAKILYGSRAANGVILVTTKKGRKNTQVIKGSVEYGANMNTRIATYLNSEDYATLYNEARVNDGFSPLYSATDIDGYKNSTGENDLFYPDVDHNSYFLKESAAFRKMNFEYSGGTDDSQYGVYLGYIGNGGLEKIGENVSQDRINIRGNLVFDLTSNLKAFIQGNGIIETRQWGKLGQDQVFGKINSERPNEFPLLIQDPNFSGEAASLGEEVIPPLGGSFQNRTSLYGDMLYGGNQEYIFFHGQTDFGLDWDLNKTIQGLSASTKLNFDSYDYYATQQKNNPIRYVVQKDENTGDATYIKLNNRSITAQVQEMGSASTRSLGSTTNIRYQTNINHNDKLTFDLSHFYYLNQNNSRRQHIKNGNTVFKVNYAYENKVFVDLTHALMTSNKFIKGNRSFLSQAVSAAWVISEEDFIGGTTFDYLKLKSSYGLIGYDASTNFYLFETRYSSAGNVNFGERNSTSSGRISFNNFGNPDLAWEKSYDFNVGVEGLAFNKSLQFELNYFNQLRDDIIYDNPSSNTTAIIGIANEPLNMGRVANQGIDGSVNWFKNFGNWKLNIGGNFIVSKNKIKQSDAINNIDSNLDVIGTSSDAIFGYVSNGIFKTQEEVDNAPVQALGQYGVGNISYKDLNDDGVIDERDRKVIGNNFPRSNFGINLDVKYKGFGLSALGVVQTGVDMIKNNAYYRNSGEGKYSTLASDRFHPVNNPNGTQPKLTTLTPTNDNVTSTFWMENASFFRLKNVELSYIVSKDTRLVKKMKFYVRGTNLFVLSDVKDLDPEVPNSGVSNYPLFRTVTGGVSLSF